MRATPLVLAIALGLGLATSGSDAAPKTDATVRADAMNTYIVVFEEPAAASFRGFDVREKGVRRPQLAATSPVATGERKYNSRSVEAVAYVEYLDELRGLRLNDAAVRLGRPVQPSYVYTHALNGMAVKLTQAEANQLLAMPGVKSVSPEVIEYLQTDRGPQWIKADLVWNGTATGTANRGEGVIVGIIDSGINRTHQAFNATGIANPRGSGNYLGHCAINPIACNNKLIGLWDFTIAGLGNTTDAPDSDGHGTHVASTAAGSPFSVYSGVAPRANIIAYKACPDACPGSMTLASINQAVADGVDVVNYSIGGSASDPWLAFGNPATNTVEAFAVAREAGIVIAASSGNDGPFESTHGSPSNAPWVIGVAAATHNRSGPGDRLASFSGRGPVIPLGVIKPDITAPGVQINAAGTSSTSSVRQLSGTSMSSPHVAGAAALVKSTNPALGADEIVSALLLTARSTVQIINSPSNPHQQGAGMTDVSLAVRAGLYLDVPANGFDAVRADPFTGGAHNLNLPSLGHGACFRTCTLTRTFRLMPGSSPASYSIQASVPAGTTITPSVASFNSSVAGQTVTFTVSVDSPQAAGQWIYGAVNLINTSGDGRPNLKLPLAIFATPFASQTAANMFFPVELPVSRERGFFDVDMPAMVPLPSARFATTDLVAPERTVQNILAHPSPSDPYTSLGVNYSRILTVPATPAGSQPVDYRIRATTSAASPDIDLYVGRDYNGNGAPNENEELCVSGSAGSSELCEFTVQSEPTATNYWVMVQNYGGPGLNVTVDSVVIAVRESATSGLVATGPGAVPTSTPYKVRVSYDDPSMIPGTERFGYVLIKAAGGDNVVVERPILLTRTGAATFEPFALANGVPRAVTLPAGTSHNKIYFDVPPHATSVQFTTTGSTGNVDLYVGRDGSPTPPVIAAAPAWNNNAALRAATAGGDETITLSGGNLQPGRWYVVPGNPGAGTVSANVTAVITGQGARPGFLSGQYANPARDGHGIFVDFAGPIGSPDQWVTVWYSYLQDNTPTWYYSQGLAPTAAGIWKAELFRVVWDGASTHAVDVGDVIITETGTESMTFNFNIDGQSGSEPMVRVGGGNCPSFNAQALDVSGHWFSPALPGFGYTYQATGGTNPQEVFIPYIYDGAGVPRWLYGQKDFNGAVNSFNMQWFSGFGPLAPRVNLAGTAAGTATRTLATNNVTNMSVNSSFGGALSGNWVQNLPVSQLSQRKNCQ